MNKNKKDKQQRGLQYLCPSVGGARPRPPVTSHELSLSALSATEPRSERA